MQQHQTFLRCTQTTATFFFILIGLLFCLAGCTQIYKAFGLTEEQTDEQVSEDQKTIIRTVTQVRTTAADIISTSIAGLGAIASGLLARLLGTERKITAVLINTIEDSDIDNIKTVIQKKATKARVESALNKRVQALT